MKRVRVLLLWPGTDGAAGGNFGVPQLVLLATTVRARTGAQVEIVDLESERALGAVSLPRIAQGQDGEGFDLVAFGVYSSFDYLKCAALAEALRPLLPRAVFAAGGYHASARPGDIVYDGSPFDVCIVGEGEKPLCTLVESIAGGAPLRNTVMPLDPVEDLDSLPPSDWSFLDRYRSVARRVNSQAQVYLSRGCPFDCAFCMERAKREVSWRALSVERALEEVRSLHRWLDLRTWTVYLADALFGMKTSWRRAFLTALAREQLPVEKFWLLIRVDLVEDEDLRLFADANCGLGFGLESGDQELLGVIRKAGRLEHYLERMREVSAWARERDVPWGANVIVGHPGETPATLERSAKYLRELFLDPKGVTGFLSVDPFRLYPGSPIDAERGAWEQRFGTRFYRPEWWHDGDQEFLAEWVDPSSELDYRTRATMQHELLSPVLAELESNFVYRGPAREYFLRAVREQKGLSSARHRAHFVDRYYAWSRYLGRSRAARARLRTDPEAAVLAQTLRRPQLESALARLGPAPDDARWRALLDRVPRERFAPLDAFLASARDEALPLDDSGDATLSAMHAYVLTGRMLSAPVGARVLDLGAGTGYGAALLAEQVGPTGRVLALEVDPALASLAREHLEPWPQASAFCADALDASTWPEEALRATHVAVGFALAELPASFERFAEGTVVVAPVGAPEAQRMVRAVRTAQGWATEEGMGVRYVRARRPEEVPRREVPREQQATRRLPVL